MFIYNFICVHSYLYVQVCMCCTGSISWKFNKIPRYKKKKAGNGIGPVCICVEGDLMSCHIHTCSAAGLGSHTGHETVSLWE